METLFLGLLGLFVLALLAGAMFNVGYSVYYTLTQLYTPYKCHKITALLNAAFLLVAGSIPLLLIAVLVGAVLAAPRAYRLRRWRDEPGHRGYTVRDVTPKKHIDMLERW